MQDKKGIAMISSCSALAGHLKIIISKAKVGKLFTSGIRVCQSSAGPESGFTLLEVLVVIVILGLLIGFVAPAVLRQLGGARVSIAHQSITRLGAVLDMYKLDVGSYPSTDQGVEALAQAPAGVSNWTGPYVQGGKVPLDPWNHPYVYRSPSNSSDKDYDLCSQGPSGTATGSSMICN
jgi:general secretion pathway protein G